MVRVTSLTTGLKSPVDQPKSSLNDNEAGQLQTLDLTDQFQVSFLEAGPDWRAFEDELDEASRPLALEARLAWVHCHIKLRARLVALRGPRGAPVSAISIAIHTSRALPGHEIWKVERLGIGSATDGLSCALQKVAKNAFQRKRVLRVEAIVISPDARTRMQIGTALAQAGFRPRLPPQQIYERTLILDLTPSEEDLFAALSKNTRRDILLPQRRGYQLRAIDDLSLTGRIEDLLQETFGRTGAKAAKVDWAAAIAFSQANPTRSRLIGIFSPNAQNRNDLLAFAHAGHHGEYAEYAMGASTRRSDAKISLSHGLLWDLIAWSKANGARWFDLGGVTNSQSGHDPLGGISALKRRFCTFETAAGEEWIFEPRPFQARLADWIGAAWRLGQR